MDEKLGTNALMEQVLEGKVSYTIADSVAISLFQRVHPELAVALDVTDEQPVTGSASAMTTTPCQPPYWISSII